MYLMINLVSLDESEVFSGKKQLCDSLDVNIATLNKAIRNKQVINNCYVIPGKEVIKTNKIGDNNRFVKGSKEYYD